MPVVCLECGNPIRLLITRRHDCPRFSTDRNDGRDRAHLHKMTHYACGFARPVSNCVQRGSLQTICPVSQAQPGWLTYTSSNVMQPWKIRCFVERSVCRHQSVTSDISSCFIFLYRFERCRPSSLAASVMLLLTCLILRRIKSFWNSRVAVSRPRSKDSC
ncbi:hypothetical protein Fuma_01060 [Fuerstiella marisgermanici]|uniref:Uncharacterized protein n=1 Tax=Fuerstiella marisgermanici TaxID=1891926 RepID=A0A1P8WBN1_9PLAN|nr:hypothetical protein Fuma_01060 [Fuerstiella marisgermanici]